MKNIILCVLLFALSAFLFAGDLPWGMSREEILSGNAELCYVGQADGGGGFIDENFIIEGIGGNWILRYSFIGHDELLTIIEFELIGGSIEVLQEVAKQLIA
jgi:hypothetical protein